MSSYPTNRPNLGILLLHALQQRQEARLRRVLERNEQWIAEVYAAPTVAETLAQRQRAV